MNKRRLEAIIALCKYVIKQDKKGLEVSLSDGNGYQSYACAGMAREILEILKVKP